MFIFGKIPIFYSQLHFEGKYDLFGKAVFWKIAAAHIFRIYLYKS